MHSLDFCHDLGGCPGSMAHSKKRSRNRRRIDAPVKTEERRRPEPDDSASLAERYYQLAETMNARGAIEIAVPFYRQALALLFEERSQLHHLLPEHERKVFDSPSEDDLVSWLQAADLLRAVQPGDGGIESDIYQDSPDLDSCIAELAEDLTPDTARQVIAGLDEMLLRCPDQIMPADGHSLRGKACILLGEVSEALSCFKAAHEMEPAQPKHAINLAGSLLTQSRSNEALPILRNLYASGVNALSLPERHALLRNLATAESQEGRPLAALQLRHQWLLSQPDAMTPEIWLEFCNEALSQPIGHELYRAAVCFLEDLHRLRSDCRVVTERLAQVLESIGDYRQAALLYRNLLRS